MLNKAFLSTIVATGLAAFAQALAAEDGGRQQDLPSVLIIGDSISIGYIRFVTQIMEGEATLSRNRGNAQHTGTGLKYIDAWLGTTKWNVIHFNWGLHDMCYRSPESKNRGNRDKVKGNITIGLEKYEKNLEELVQRLGKTGAVLVWATTTVVPEGDTGRFVGDDRKYNEVAARVMKKHGIMINDLNALTAGFSPDLFLGPGNVHYKPEGYKKLANQVAEKIRAALARSSGATTVNAPGKPLKN
jgi:hypothetical protein